MALSELRQRFVREYLIDRNGVQAYIRAGYKARGHAAEANASRLLRNAEVAAAIAAAEAERARRTEITADRVIQELARIGLADPRRLMKWGPAGVKLLDSAAITEADAAAVESVSQTITESGETIRLKCHSKPAALKLLGEHLGIFKERDPLEVLLGSLPSELAAAVRRELGRLLAGGPNSPGGPFADSPDRSGGVGP